MKQDSKVAPGPITQEDIANKLGEQTARARGYFSTLVEKCMQHPDFDGSRVDQSIEIARALLFQLDRGLTEIVAEYENQGVKAACRPGCSWCCCVPVLTAPLEAFHIADYLERQGRFAHSLSRRLRTRSNRRWAGENPECIFLAERHCSIYPVRPIKCRAYFGPDAEACRLNTSTQGPVSWMAVCVSLSDGLLATFVSLLVYDRNPIPVQLFEDSLRAIIDAGGTARAWAAYRAQKPVFGPEWPHKALKDLPEDTDITLLTSEQYSERIAAAKGKHRV